MVQSFKKIIDFWDSPVAMADEVGARVETVKKWKQRDSIPGDWWLAIAQSETGQNKNLTVEQMATLAGAKNATALLAATA